MTEKSATPVALVTGGASGIGRAAAIRFAARGDTVVVADVDQAGARQTVELIRSAGGTAGFVACAVQHEAQVQSLLERIDADFGRLDFALNNAGVEQRRATIADCTEENWDNTIDIDLKGVWLSLKHEIKLMRRTGGSIVNTSSVVGLGGVAGAPAYVAAKHGIIGLTKCAALEEAEHGIRVNAICPGHILTPMVERVITKEPAKEQTYIDNAPMHRLGDPDEVAKVVAWLCSEESSFVTGSPVNIDGGVRAR